jgi:DNA-binding SARP family transcriptional activator
MTVRYLVLGPIAVERDEVLAPIAGARAQALLAALVISANHVVPVDRLVEALWPGEGPASPGHALHSQISKLRRLIGDGIEHVGPGYALRATCGQIDACRFERLVRQAEEIRRSEPGPALAAARSALALWRGPAFGEVAGNEPYHLEAMRLEELRIDVQEVALEAMVASGLADEAVAELRAAVADHPYRERLWKALLEGLVSLKRRGEALEVYESYERCMSGLGLAADPDVAGVVDRLFPASR